MSVSGSVLSKLAIIQCLVIFCVSQEFDFFYLVQQWPGSYCDTKRGCCFPVTGKPSANFTIHGLWPNGKNNTWPEFCDREKHFNQSQISDLMSRMQRDWPSLNCPSSNNMKFWTHEWEKHGTCSLSVFEDEHQYFEVTLQLKERIDLLQVLQNADIHPDGRKYSLGSIKEAIKAATGHIPGITCNTDASKINQLHEIYLCVNRSGTEFIECPVLPKAERGCASKVEFPIFGEVNIKSLATSERFFFRKFLTVLKF